MSVCDEEINYFLNPVHYHTTFRLIPASSPPTTFTTMRCRTLISSHTTLVMLMLNVADLPVDTISFSLRPWILARHPQIKHHPRPLAASPLKEDSPDNFTMESASTAFEVVGEEPDQVSRTTQINTVEELTETQKLLQKVKQAGTAGAISYALWELGFWGISIPVCIFGYREVTGHWPDLTNKEDVEKVGAEAFAFVNFARLAVPLRIGLALSTAGWIDENVVQKFFKSEGGKEGRL